MADETEHEYDSLNPESELCRVNSDTPLVSRKSDFRDSGLHLSKASSLKSMGTGKVSTGNHHETKPRTNPTMIVVLFSALNILLVILNALSVYYVNKESRNTVERPQSQLCVDCDTIRLHPDDKVDNISQYDDVCCANEPENVGALVSYFTQHWMKKKTATENKPFAYCRNNETKPALKLVGVDDEQPDNSPNRIIWRSGDIVKQGKISYKEKDGEIQIEKSGLYQVYSQLGFRLNNTDGEETPHRYSGILLHKVVRVNAGYGSLYEETVLRSMDTPCVHDSPVYYYSSYLSSVVQLKDGDRLYVKVHSREDIQPDKPQLHWFGAHLV